ncbi:MAG: hypothetical protein BYD32DRAFT_435418 [Podila humilis]|nr:MAG: hypothetical protein BYD32DRAFT_435418 [Podila humilis]
MDVDHDEGYYYTGQTPFRKPNETKIRFHARRLVSIQTLGRLEYTVEEAETKFNRALGPVELTFVGLETPLLFRLFRLFLLCMYPTYLFFMASNPPLGYIYFLEIWASPPYA